MNDTLLESFELFGWGIGYGIVPDRNAVFQYWSYDYYNTEIVSQETVLLFSFMLWLVMKGVVQVQ